MKHLILLWILLPALVLATNARQVTQPEPPQVFYEALELYESYEFEEAVELFSTLNFAEAWLFAGKSHFALGSFHESHRYLELAKASGTLDIRHEAGFTAGLSHFFMRNYGRAFNELWIVKIEAEDAELSRDAGRYIESFNRFLTPQERLAAISETEIAEIQELILVEGIRLSDEDSARELISEAIRMGLEPQLVSRLRQEFNRQSFRGRQVAYEAPEGYTYNIGLLLPQQRRGAGPYEVSRNLYFGMLMAVERFNLDQSGLRAALHVAEMTGDDDIPSLMQKLKEEYRVDVIFGPLFSEDARIAASLSEELEIPVIAPLANSDELADLSPYFFQSNPTFRERGKKMADVAVNILGYDSLAVLTEMSTMGVQEAAAFRDYARSHGAEITHNYVGDFRSMRFDLTNYTQHFALNKRVAPDTTINIRPTDALFLPLTGASASTLIDIILTDLLAFRSPVSIIGTEEWGLSEISPEAIQRFNIVYSGIFHRDETSEDVINFRSDFKTQFGRDADQFAFAGYDNGLLIMDTIMKAGNPAVFAEYLRNRSRFESLGQWFDFNGGQVNTAIRPLLITPTGTINIDRVP